LIADSTLSHSLTVLTANAKHFSVIERLRMDMFMLQAISFKKMMTNCLFIESVPSANV